ncbi:hypothetical protein [Pseudorhodobacter sp.]|uniref:hypothetical protein n=2 Tax=Pseudorhodobacter sp. TaxID=1934400 RepID=UPI002AFFC0C9|nr:hypothetical protein [Pseudorhodobacter sp.]
MGAGQAILIWFIGSGIACVLLLAWAAVVGLGAGRHRALAMTLLALTGALAILPSGLDRLRKDMMFPFSPALFIGATLCLLAAGILLWKMRRTAEMRRSADLGLAACLNLWLALWVVLTPLSYF